MKLPGNHGPGRPAGQTHTSEGSDNGRFAVVGNERLTALAGAVLLVLLLVDIVSSASLHALLPIHIFVGVRPATASCAITPGRQPTCAEARPACRYGCWPRCSSSRPSW